MDPVVLQLLMQMSQAKGGNKNLSGTLNNMDNPLLLALAGVLDPMSGQGAGQSSGIYNQFANDPNTPATVQQVMDWVDQGLNKYQIESMVTQLPDTVVTDGGYTKKQLVSMANDMTKQRSSGTDKSGLGKLTQAGYRNPNDIYGLMDVPLSAGSQKRLAELQTGYEPIANKMANQESRTRVAANKMRGFGTEVKSKLADDLSRDANTMATGGASVALRDLAKYVASNPYLTVEDLNKQVDSISSTTSALPGEVKQFRKRALKYADALAKTATSTSEVKSVDRGKAIADWEQSKMAESKIKAEASNNARLQEAIRQANLDQAARTGRTPFTDQASQLMKFIAGTK
jgi:hypothetical protein